MCRGHSQTTMKLKKSQITLIIFLFLDYIFYWKQQLSLKETIDEY